MTYATPTHLLTRFAASEIAQRADRGDVRLVTAQLMTDAAAEASLAAYTADERAAAAAALAVVQRALDDARDTINAHISTRYTLPIWPVPPILERIACNLARYYLFDDQVTDRIQAAYDSDMTTLRGVRDGKNALGAEAVGGQAPASSAAAEMVTEGRVWSRSESKGFI